MNLKLKSVKIDWVTLQATVKTNQEESIKKLTHKQAALLAILYEKRDTTTTRKHLMKRLNLIGTDRVIDVHKLRLTASLPIIDKFLKTISGEGYRLQTEI